MRFMTELEALSNAVMNAQRAVAVRSTNELLKGILMEAQAGQLRLVGYDKSIGIEANIPCNSIEDGRVVVDARMLTDIVRKLSGHQVQVETEESQHLLVVKTNQSCFRIAYQEADGYPDMPKVQRSEALVLPQRLLQNMIQKTVFACSQDETRPNMNGCLLAAKDQEVTMVAIDGFRLALARHHRSEKDAEKDGLTEGYPERRLVIPGKALRELQQILGASEWVSIYPHERHILFDCGQAVLVTQLTTDEFIDYTVIIPKSYETQISLETENLVEAVDRALLLTAGDQNNSPVRLEIKQEGKLLIDMQSSRGTLHEEIPVEVEGEATICNFNPRFLADALRVVEDSEMKISFMGEIGPCHLKPMEGDSFAYILVPLRQ